jgi:hypothetical protein
LIQNIDIVIGTPLLVDDCSSRGIKMDSGFCLASAEEQYDASCNAASNKDVVLLPEEGHPWELLAFDETPCVVLHHRMHRQRQASAEWWLH